MKYLIQDYIYLYLSESRFCRAKRGRFLFSFLIFLTIGVLLSFSFSVSAQEFAPKAPETFEEAKSLGERILIGFPEALKKPWQEALVVWGRMLGWFRSFWRSYISPWLQIIWQKIYSLLGKEVEKRKPEIQEEFKKEKQEIKEETVEAGKSLWQRFKDLIK